jgi:hypothetical protein
MYKRYEGNRIKKDISGKRYLSQTIYPEIIVSNDDWYFISTKGDRLDLYAHNFYGDSRLWYIIAQANHLGKGTMVVPAGIQIRIPMDLTKIEFDLKQLNS